MRPQAVVGLLAMFLMVFLAGCGGDSVASIETDIDALKNEKDLVKRTAKAAEIGQRISKMPADKQAGLTMKLAAAQGGGLLKDAGGLLKDVIKGGFPMP